MTSTDAIDLRAPAATSFWLETCGDDLTPRPPLDGSTEADVAILGAGYSGLWTALYLLRRQPSLRVVVVEQAFAGFGASGRNGGWVVPELNISIPELARRYGTAAARSTVMSTIEAVDEVGRAAAEEGIEADWHKGGRISVARGPNQLPAFEETLQTYERFGFGDRHQRLDAAQLASKVRVAGGLGGIFTADNASVHPAKLVRGLAHAVERRGATIHESTVVTGFTPGMSADAARGRSATLPVLHTDRGDVRARTVVLAGEAWLTRLKPLHRQLIPPYSLIVLTEPLSDEQWATIGWADRECVHSFRESIDYLARTPDGRILFGGRGAPYHFGSRIRPEYDDHPATHEMLRGMVRAWFPSLADVRFSHSWGGPLGMARDWMPSFSHDPVTGVASARGYVGHGVAITNLAARTLVDLILETPSELTELPMANHRSPNWEPEPLRVIGVRYTQQAFAGIDDTADRTGKPPRGPSLARLLGRH
ncbi:MAG TPA: FAD-dependent oxidoreductase [Candidatus Saccharimonadia bacterium]|nr:FAD-dependent oxidoreductase [Candidatus Saccharimonadia bacterium]